MRAADAMEPRQSLKVSIPWALFTEQNTALDLSRYQNQAPSIITRPSGWMGPTSYGEVTSSSARSHVADGVIDVYGRVPEYHQPRMDPANVVAEVPQLHDPAYSDISEDEIFDLTDDADDATGQNIALPDSVVTSTVPYSNDGSFYENFPHDMARTVDVMQNAFEVFDARNYMDRASLRYAQRVSEGQQRNEGQRRATKPRAQGNRNRSSIKSHSNRTRANPVRPRNSNRTFRVPENILQSGDAQSATQVDRHMSNVVRRTQPDRLYTMPDQVAVDSRIHTNYNHVSTVPQPVRPYHVTRPQTQTSLGLLLRAPQPTRWPSNQYVQAPMVVPLFGTNYNNNTAAPRAPMSVVSVPGSNISETAAPSQLPIYNDPSSWGTPTQICRRRNGPSTDDRCINCGWDKKKTATKPSQRRSNYYE